MRSLSAPQFSFNDVFNACVNGKYEPARSNLFSISDTLQQMEYDYRALATTSQLYALPKNPDHVVIVDSKNELFKLYDERMAKNPSPGRKYYDQILAAGLPRCPYCNHNRPRQLDHVLPKEVTGYPELSLLPINLVPSCADCNFYKRTHDPTTFIEQLFHPYFDSPEKVVWLTANLDFLPTGELTVFFETIEFPGFESFSQRVRFQFNMLGLSRLYGAQAATELESIRYGLELLFEAHGAGAVRERMNEDYVSFNDNDQNSWKTAMYRCICQSERICQMNWTL